MITASGIDVEVSGDMMRDCYIGYDRNGFAICTGRMGVGHLKHMEGQIHRLVVGVETWKAMQQASSPPSPRERSEHRTDESSQMTPP